MSQPIGFIQTAFLYHASPWNEKNAPKLSNTTNNNKSSCLYTETFILWNQFDWCFATIENQKLRTWSCSLTVTCKHKIIDCVIDSIWIKWICRIFFSVSLFYLLPFSHCKCFHFVEIKLWFTCIEWPSENE